MLLLVWERVRVRFWVRDRNRDRVRVRVMVRIRSVLSHCRAVFSQQKLESQGLYKGAEEGRQG